MATSIATGMVMGNGPSRAHGRGGAQALWHEAAWAGGGRHGPHLWLVPGARACLRGRAIERTNGTDLLRAEKDRKRRGQRKAVRSRPQADRTAPEDYTDTTEFSQLPNGLYS